MKHAVFFRRFAALALAMICCLSLWSAALGQDEAFTGYTTASLRLREEPNANAKVLVVIPAGGAVLITGDSGDFYKVTYEGVRGYAMKQYLKVSGTVTAPTAAPTAYVPETVSAYSVLSTGSRGDAVTALQSALKELGIYTSSVDGQYGNGTRNAVSSFQKMNGLSQTGTADAATQQLLYEGTPKNSKGKAVTVKTVAPIEGAVIRSGSTGTAVSRLQTRLKELGYYTGKVDGDCGSGTVSAIKAFQKKNGLSQTGTADAATQKALYAASAVSAKATATPKPTATPTPIPTNAPTAAPAATYPYTTYTLASVNLRKEASTESSRLLTVPKGAEITVLSASGNYVRATYNGKTGYLVAEYVNVPAQYLPGSSLKEDTQAQQQYAYLQSGMSGKNVALLQEALKELGFYSGALDGSFNASTLAAVKAFQKKNGLKQDGVASPEIQKLIFEGKPLNSKGKKTDVSILPNIENIDLKLGDKGDQVAVLQRQLKQLGFYTGEATGVFDAATQAAVKRFQSAHSMTVDGVVGPKTRLLINTILSTPTPGPYQTQAPTMTPAPTATPLTAQNVVVMRNGTKHIEVVKLQNRLMELGYYTCIANGVYDSDEVAAVTEFQRKNGLTIDGVAGLETQLRLYSDAALPATTAALPTAVPTAAPSDNGESVEILQTGSRGAPVTKLQQRLKELGYYTGAVDGQYGSGTAQAVTQFQRANGLTADGVAGIQTQNVLYASGSVKPQATATPAPTATPKATATPAVTLLRSGDTGDAVKAMQQRLVELGYLAAADGIYGPRTYNAVVAFQKRNSLTADGIAGKMTLNRLNSSSAIAAKNTVTPTPTPAPASTAFRVPAASEVKYENWYTTIRALARKMPDVVIYDPDSGLHFNLHMFSFGKHADSETPTAADTAVLNQICGVNSWTPKYVWVIFSNGEVYIGSIHSHGHEVDHTAGNNLDGHICLHFPRVMSEAEATGPYAVSHQKEINWGWELTQAKIK